MAGVVARLVVVFVAVVIPGGVTSQDCNTGDVQVSVDEGQVKVINTEYIRTVYGSITLYIKVKTGFEGVRLDAQGTDGSEHTAWFPKDKCLLQSDEWLQVIAMAEIDNDKKKLKLDFMTGSTCNKYCERDNPPPRVKTLKVVAYGPSSWITTRPPFGCKVNYAVFKEYEETCQSPPTTSTKLSHKTTIIIGSSTAGVVMVVVVVVFGRRKFATRREVRCESQPHEQPQVTLGQGHTPAQDESIYDEIVFIDMTPPPAQHPDELIYDDVAAPHPPLYENLNSIYDDMAPPTACLGHPGLRESDLYATVL